MFIFADVKKSLTVRRLVAVLLSALLLSPGWLSLSGFTLLAAFVPLLWVSDSYDGSRRAWWGMFGWAALAFVLWNVATVWWIWFATPVGPIAATLASTTLNLFAFMSFHTVSKSTGRGVGYATLVAAWIATEYAYTVSDFSWPWLVLGNGFSHDVWAVQWYEFTGVFGGSLWVLLCNIALFEAWREWRRMARWIVAGCVVALPMIGSSVIWLREGRRTAERSVAVSIIQPNVDCYEKFSGDEEVQEENIHDLLAEVPAEAEFILLPETAVPGYYREPELIDIYFPDGGTSEVWLRLADSLRSAHPDALLVTGANTMRFYGAAKMTPTARMRAGTYYDYFNTAVGLDSTGRVQIHHKGRLVIGVENTPTWVFDALRFLVIDLGGTLGQIGKGEHGTAFEHNGVRMGPAICYEGLYGDFFGDFVRRGAQFMAIVSNDGWWGDTPGYRHLFTISRLRAIEHRRAIARSANTGRSGFISPRGDVGETLGWEERGVLTARVPLETRTTVYTRYGDYIARVAVFLMVLCILYAIVYRIRRKNHLVP